MRTQEKNHEKVIFEYSHPGRGATDQWPEELPASATADLPQQLRRTRRAVLPEVSELETVRHFTRLSHLNFSIDTHFYPLGSCTMKYNPKACNQYAMLPEFLGRHPLAPESHGQGFLACMYELQEMLKEVTGMQGVALSPMAGAHGEFAGVAMIAVTTAMLNAIQRHERSAHRMTANSSCVSFRADAAATSRVTKVDKPNSPGISASVITPKAML